MKSGQEISPDGSENPELIIGSVSVVSDVLIGCVSVALDVLVIGALVVVGRVVETAGDGTEDGCVVEIEGIGSEVCCVVTEEVLLAFSPQEIKSIKIRQSIKNIASFFM